MTRGTGERGRAESVKKMTVLEALESMHRRLGDVMLEADAKALPWALGGGGRLPAAPDLRRRFRATEDELDELGRTEADGGAIAAEVLAGAVAAHEAVWREIVARYRRHLAEADRRARGAA